MQGPTKTPGKGNSSIKVPSSGKSAGISKQGQEPGSKYGMDPGKGGKKKSH